jgi:hypothetical protein
VFAAREFALGHLSLGEAITEAGLPTEQFLGYLSRIVSLGDETTATVVPPPATEPSPRISIVIPDLSFSAVDVPFGFEQTRRPFIDR